MLNGKDTVLAAVWKKKEKKVLNAKHILSSGNLQATFPPPPPYNSDLRHVLKEGQIGNKPAPRTLPASWSYPKQHRIKPMVKQAQWRKSPISTRVFSASGESQDEMSREARGRILFLTNLEVLCPWRDHQPLCSSIWHHFHTLGSHSWKRRTADAELCDIALSGAC